MDKHQWNARYLATDRMWSVAPNQFVEAELDSLAPGRALDIAAGEGRNAIWLATRGWRVTAVDFAKAAIDRGHRVAMESGVSVDWQVADVLTYEPDAEAFDVALLVYLQLPTEPMKQVLRRAVSALSHGGTLLVVGHDSRNLVDGYGGPQSAAVLYTPEWVAQQLVDLEIARAETVERVVVTNDGQRTALDCVVRATRNR